MKTKRKEIVDALCDILDGIYNPYELQSKTGFELKRCREILAIRDSVKKEWLEK